MKLAKLVAAALLSFSLLGVLVTPASAEADTETMRDIVRGDYKGETGDFDGNGKVDGFRVTRKPGASRTNLLQVRYDNIGPWVTVNQTTTVRSQLRIADFNGNGKDDVFVKWPSGRWAYLAEGKGKWVIISLSKQSIASLSFVDLDGDSKADVTRVRKSTGIWRNGVTTATYEIQYVPTGNPRQGWVRYGSYSGRECALGVCIIN